MGSARKKTAKPKLHVPNLNRHFTASGDVYFRKYRYDELYFKENTLSLQGAQLPFQTVQGIPNDNENSQLYSYYVYPKTTPAGTVKKK